MLNNQRVIILITYVFPLLFCRWIPWQTDFFSHKKSKARSTGAAAFAGAHGGGIKDHLYMIYIYIYIYDILLHDIVCKYMMIMMYMIPSAQARQSWSRCAPPSATAGTSGAMAGSWGVWMVKPMGKMVIFHGFVDLRKGLRGWMCGFIWLYNVSYIYIYIHAKITASRGVPNSTPTNRCLAW